MNRSFTIRPSIFIWVKTDWLGLTVFKMLINAGHSLSSTQWSGFLYFPAFCWNPMLKILFLIRETAIHFNSKLLCVITIFIYYWYKHKLIAVKYFAIAQGTVISSFWKYNHTFLAFVEYNKETCAEAISPYSSCYSSVNCCICIIRGVILDINFTRYQIRLYMASAAFVS